MTAKAVYVSSSFAVYITAEELDDFLESGEYLCELFVGRVRIPAMYAHVRLDLTELDTIRKVRAGERQAIAEGRRAAREASGAGNEP